VQENRSKESDAEAKRSHFLPSHLLLLVLRLRSPLLQIRMRRRRRRRRKEKGKKKDGVASP